jgi:hypothetical protein
LKVMTVDLQAYIQEFSRREWKMNLQTQVLETM